jgi:hypothetical protein
VAEPLQTEDKTQRAADFDTRHAEDLGVKRFAVKTGLQTIIPLGAMAAGGALGYFALGGPLLRMFPRQFAKIGHVSDFARSALKIDISKLGPAKEQIERICKEALEKIRATEPDFQVTSGQNLKRLIDEMEQNPEQIRELKKTLNLTTDSEQMAAKFIGAGLLGIPASMFGSLAVAYDEWRNEESARLAAREIDRDISKLEIFRPSNPELVAENKRLRAMLAETEKKTEMAAPANDDQPRTTVTEADHQGAAKDAAERQRAG